MMMREEEGREERKRSRWMPDGVESAYNGK